MSNDKRTSERAMVLSDGCSRLARFSLLVGLMLAGCVGDVLADAGRIIASNHKTAASSDQPGFANVEMQVEATPVSKGRYWLLPRMHMHNASQKTVRPFVVRWYFQTPPSPGTFLPQTERMWNDLDFGELPIPRDEHGAILADHRAALARNGWKDRPFTALLPGQISEVAIPVLIETTATTALIHADVVFTSDGVGACSFDPSKLVEANSIDRNPTPTVCILEKGVCKRDAGCVVQSLERMVSLPKLN